MEKGRDSIESNKKIGHLLRVETRWKGGSARNIGWYDVWFKFFWVGCEDVVAGVGVSVAGRWMNSVVEARRENERVIVLR
jgi:hypothetical protein